MASTIRIKRSTTQGDPSTLAAGELAYSSLAGLQSNGGDRLYIGMGSETGGNAANHFVIGGKYFTDMMDHVAGTLTASSAILVDADKKIDDLLVDNLELNGNTLSVTNVNGNLILQPNGTGKVSINNAYTLPNADGTANYVLTTDGSGAVTFQKNELSVGADTGTTASVSILTGSLTIAGGEGIDTSVSGSTITIAGEDATTSNKGVASFSSSNFDVASGAVSIKTGGVSNSNLVNSKTTLGSTDLTLGATTASVYGLNTAQVGDIQLSGSTIASQSTNTNLNITLAGTTKLSINSAYTLPRTDGSAGYVLTTDGAGSVTFQAASSSLTIKDDANNTDSISLLSDTFSILGGEGIDTLVTDNTVTISAEDATTTNKGVASFNAADFTVSSGAVSVLASRVQDIVNTALAEGEGIDITFNSSTHVTTIAAELATDTNAGVASFSNASFTVSGAGAVTIKSGGVTNAQLVNSKVTIGSTDISLGATTTNISGLLTADIGYIHAAGSTIAITSSTYEMVLDPSNGISTGTINVSNARITNLATPINGNDAATKNYVDNSVSGLSWKEAVNLLADTNVALTGATNTLVIDGHSALDSADNGIYRILLTGQTSTSTNGIYTYFDDGSNYTLTRATDADTASELTGASVFVQEGTVYGKTGWVQSNHYLTDLTGGGGYQQWVQFSGAGQYSAGVGLTLSGNDFYINTATGTGLYISGDTLQVDPTLAGDGLTYNTGVLAVGGTTDRISVSADAIDIAATYVGQTSITTLGTVSVGTWTATTVGAAYGGTGISSFTTGDILYASGSTTLTKLTAGATGTVLQILGGVPVWAMLDGGTY